jgi:hypothetical protein
MLLRQLVLSRIGIEYSRDVAYRDQRRHVRLRVVESRELDFTRGEEINKHGTLPLQKHWNLIAASLALLRN